MTTQPKVAAQSVVTSTTVYLPTVGNGDAAVATAPEEAEIVVDEAAHAEAAAVDGVTTTVTKYYFLGSQRVAMSIGGDLRYLHADHLGSIVMETYLNGTLRTDQKYYAFGSQRDSGPVLTEHKFTGQKLDGTGLYYYNARYYDPFIGQFISPDTIVPDAGNVLAYQRYMYALGNPLKYSDPSGHAYEIGGGPLWPTLAIFANGINQTEGTPALQGEQLQAALQTIDSLNVDVYVPLPVYTSGSTAVDAAQVYWGAVSDAIVPGSQIDQAHAAAVNMNTTIDEAVKDGEITFYRHQTVHLIAHSGGGAYVDDLAQHLINEYGVHIETITTLGSPYVNYNEATAMADRVTMITAQNDPLGWIGLAESGSMLMKLIDDSFSAKVLDAQAGGHTGYGQNPELIQYLADLFAE